MRKKPGKPRPSSAPSGRRRAGASSGKPRGRTSGGAGLIERVRRIALALPDTTEKLSHGEPSFFVRGKMFFTLDNNHHGSGHLAIWCRAESGLQPALVEAEPRHFFVPPYVGPSGWLGVRLDSGLQWATIAAIVEHAWHEAAPPRLGATRARPALPRSSS